MKSPFENISISYLLAIIASILISLLGISVLIGWYSHNLQLIQVSPAFVPMQFNTALGFVLSGMGLLMIIRQHRAAGTVIGIFIMLIGLLTLIEYILELDLGIDQLLLQHYITTETSHPGRMAPNTALCFLLTGAALIVLGQLADAWKSSMMLGILAALIFGLGIIALAGYAISFESAYGWNNLTRMAVHTAGGFVLIGMALANLAWHRSISAPLSSPFCLTIPVGILVVMVMSYSLISSSRMAERHAPQQDAVMEIMLQAAIGHLWFEELISGDQYIDISIIWKKLDQSAWYARALLEGGENAEGIFIPLINPVLRSQIEEVLLKIDEFRTIAEKRLANQKQSGIGSDIDQHYDALFKDLLTQANEVETALQSSMARELHQFQILQSLLFIFILGLSVIIGIVIFRYERWQKFTTEILQNNEIHLRTLFNTVPDLIWLKDTDGVYLNCNPKFERLFGAKQSEIVGKTDYDYIDRELADFFHKNDKAAMDTNKPIMNEEVITYADDGHQETVETIKTPMFDFDGKLIGVLGIARDITERKRIDSILQESEEKYRALYENAPLSYQSLNEQGCIRDINPSWLSTLGYEREEVIGKWFGDFLHPDWKTHFEKNFPEFKRRGYVKDVQFRMKHKKGNFLDVSFEGCIGYKPDGSFRQSYCVFKDITEQKSAEARANEQESVLTSVFQALPDLFFLMDQDGTIREYRAQQSDDLYVSPDTFLGKKMRDILPPSIARQFEENISRAFKNDGLSTFEYALEMPQGQRQYEARITRLSDSTQIIAIVRDITERKQVEKQLAEQHEHLEELVKERTKKLEEKNKELKQYNELFLNREFRIKELRDRVKELEAKKSSKTEGLE